MPIFKYFLHYSKTTGKLIGYDTGSHLVSKEDFERGKTDWATVEVTEKEFNKREAITDEKSV